MKNKENECNPQCNPLHIEVTLLPDTDLVKAWKIIDSLQPGEIYDVNKIPDSRRDLFINCIKQRINTLNDCEFSNNFKKIKKLNNFYYFSITDWNRDQKT